MRADKAIRAMLDRENASTIQVSRELGKSDGYITAILAKRTIPKADTMSSICDVLGYELVAKSRDDDFEIPIDPQE